MSVESHSNPEKQPRFELPPLNVEDLERYINDIMIAHNYFAGWSANETILKKQFGMSENQARFEISKYEYQGMLPTSDEYEADPDASRDKLRLHMFANLLPKYEIHKESEAVIGDGKLDYDDYDTWVEWSLELLAAPKNNRHKLELCAPGDNIGELSCKFGMCPLRMAVARTYADFDRYSLRGVSLYAANVTSINESSYTTGEKIRLMVRFSRLCDAGLISEAERDARCSDLADCCKDMNAEIVNMYNWKEDA